MDYDRIYHIALPADWEAAIEVGEYRISTRGRTLDEEGFIHCSASGDQVDRVAQAFYAGVDDLVLLTIDPWRVGAPVRFEPVGPDGEEYPHIYGPLPVDAVVAARPLVATTREGPGRGPGPSGLGGRDSNPK